jgi:hypothetical protein
VKSLEAHAAWLWEAPLTCGHTAKGSSLVAFSTPLVIGMKVTCPDCESKVRVVSTRGWSR